MPLEVGAPPSAPTAFELASSAATTVAKPGAYILNAAVKGAWHPKSTPSHGDVPSVSHHRQDSEPQLVVASSIVQWRLHCTNKRDSN
jgi:hypothetical protein